MDDDRSTARKSAEAQLIARAQKDPAFRQELVNDPKGVFARELGLSMPDTIGVQVLEERPDQVYLVLPPAPASIGTELSDADLEVVAGGWSGDSDCYCATAETCPQTCAYC